MTDEILTLKQVADYLKLAEKTAYRLATEGKLLGVKDKMKGKNLRSFVREKVDTANSHLMTDEYKGYLGMSKVVPHSVIKHQKWYVDGNIHTNTIESFWALLKRGVFGQFHSISKKYLQRYVDEFCYRYNLREVGKADAFDMTLNLALGV